MRVLSIVLFYLLTLMRVLSKYPLILRCFILFTNTDEGIEQVSFDSRSCVVLFYLLTLMRVLSKYPLIPRCFILFTNTDEGVEHCFILFTNTDEGVEQVSVD